MSSPRAGCISVNGRLSAPHEATVSALDAGFLLGDGLFESLRATDGIPYLLDRHLARLLAAARELEFEGMPSAPDLAGEVLRTLERAALADAYLRVTVTRGSGATALGAPSGAPTVVIAALPPPARGDAVRGIEATLLGAPVETGATAKSTSRQQAVLARREVVRSGAGEGLYVSAEGYVLEGVSSNLFVVRDGRLLTPPIEHCLPGITRGRVLELAGKAGVEVAEGPVEVDLLMGAEEVFVTNAVQGLRRVGAIDGNGIGTANPNGVFVRLGALYDADRQAMTRV
jgi:branched-subunit amino acid aminotransferase/4-amino-4-deoxychorismate lyase